MALQQSLVLAILVSPSFSQPGPPARPDPVPNGPIPDRLSQILQDWERESTRIHSFRCPFHRKQYDDVFGPPGIPLTEDQGELKYVKPDKGLFRITEIRRYNTTTRKHELQKDEPGEHWVCDGKNVHELDARLRQLKVYPLPPEHQGKAIADGPLPFLFGAEAKKLQDRYQIQLQKESEEQIWLHALPRWQQDAANFKSVDLILDAKKFLPYAIQVHEPGGKSRTVYVFVLEKAKINHPLDRLFFPAPRLRPGWKRVIAASH